MAAGLEQALRSLGHTVEEHPEKYDVLLIDSDQWTPGSHCEQIIDHAYKQDAKVIVYPHGAMHQYDLFPPVPHSGTSAALVYGPAMRGAWVEGGYPLHVYDVGWWLCDLLPFAVTEIRNVLFAPVHRDFGWTDAERDATEQAYARTVGLGLVTTWYAGTEDQVKAIDRHDLVVAQGTFAMRALARGKHTVIYGPPPAYMNYPVGFDTLDRMGELPVWRDRWLGAQMTAERLEQALLA